MIKLTPIAKSILETKRAVTYSFIPKTVSMFKEEFLRSIPSNDYFTNEEKHALSLYLNMQSNFNSRSIRLFESRVDEDVASWFRSGWNKLKQVFGTAKDYIVKVWTKIKEAFVSVIKKGYDWVQGQISSFREKVKDNIIDAIAGPNKNAFLKELTHMTLVRDFFKGRLTDPEQIVDDLDDQVIEPAAAKADASGQKVEESIIFDKKFTESIFNPNHLLTETGTQSKWMKWLGNIIKIVLNPVMGTLTVAGKWLGEKFLEKAAVFIEKIGGPKAIKYHVTPELVTAIMEVTGMYNGVWEFVLDQIEPFIEAIPFLGELIHFWELGHKALVVYAVYEIIVQTADTLDKAGANLSTSL